MDFFSKSEQISRKLRIWSHLLKKSLMENFNFCAVRTLPSISNKAFFAKICSFLAVDHFRKKKTRSEIFDRVLNLPLHLIHD